MKGSTLDLCEVYLRGYMKDSKEDFQKTPHEEPKLQHRMYLNEAQ